MHSLYQKLVSDNTTAGVKHLNSIIKSILKKKKTNTKKMGEDDNVSIVRVNNFKQISPIFLVVFYMEKIRWNS